MIVQRALAFAAIGILAACSNGPSMNSTSPSPIPSGWIALTSRANGFTLYHPPEWAPRDLKSRPLAFEDYCQDTNERPNPDEGETVYSCELVPASAGSEGPDQRFYLRVEILVPYPDTDSAKDFVEDIQGTADEPVVRRGVDLFGERTWYVVDRRSEPRKMSGTVPCRCYTRFYAADHPGDLFVAFDVFALSPDDWNRFITTAEQVVHSIHFHS